MKTYTSRCETDRHKPACALSSGRRASKPGRVHFHIWDYADVWFRDYGPTFVVNRELQQDRDRAVEIQCLGREVSDAR